MVLAVHCTVGEMPLQTGQTCKAKADHTEGTVLIACAGWARGRRLWATPQCSRCCLQSRSAVLASHPFSHPRRLSPARARILALYRVRE